MAAMDKAVETGCKMDIAVVDREQSLKAFFRMEGAWLGNFDIAIKKATIARYFDMPTAEKSKLSQPGGPFYYIELSNKGLKIFSGGVPLKDTDGTISGAYWVSSSTVEGDYIVAMAGCRLF